MNIPTDEGLFHSDIQSIVLSLTYDFRLGMGTLVLPPHCCGDFSGTIRAFKAIDSSVTRIEVRAGAEIVNVYRRVFGEWKAGR